MRTWRTKIGMGLAIVGVGFTLVGWRLRADAPDLSSPKSTTRAFVDALKRKDNAAIAACVKGSTAGADLDKILNDPLGPALSITNYDIKEIIAETEGDRARVAVNVTIEAPWAGKDSAQNVRVSLVEMFTLQKEGDQWRIAPDEEIMKAISAPEKADTKINLRPLSVIAAYAGSPQIMMKAFEAERGRTAATTCLSSQKQIAIGILMYVQDYDEVFPRKKAPYNEIVMPYIKNNEVFRCPLDAKGVISYTLNANIQGATLASLVAPAQTILTYEGKDMKLDFRHDGKAAVSFTDGHAKLITPEEAKEVFWYAEGKEPLPKVVAPPKTKPQSKPKPKTKPKK